MGSWFWAMSSYFWHTASAVRRGGEVKDHAVQVQLLLDRLPACTFETLEHAVCAADTIQLEHLAWAVFNNIMGPGETPPLFRLETYSQVLDA